MDDNEILQYFHCAKCLNESLTQHLEAGWTKHGLQIRCIKHDCNVINIDFKGQKVGAK